MLLALGSKLCLVHRLHYVLLEYLDPQQFCMVHFQAQYAHGWSRQLHKLYVWSFVSASYVLIL